MNKRLKILAALLLLPMSVIVPVLTIDGHSSHSQPVSAQSNQSFEQRKRDYRNQLNEELRSTDERRITLRCDVVQTNLRTLNSRIDTVRTDRNDAYNSILERLNDLTDRLNNQAYEISQLESNVATLTSKVNTFKSDINNYKQAVDDLTKIDCKEDQTTFMGALQVARQYHGGLLPQGGDIRGYIANTIQPTLQQVKGEIEAGRTSGGSR